MKDVDFFDSACRPAIVCLFFIRGPTAIVRFIVSVVIREAIKSESGWAFPHVFKKHFKTIQPRFAHGNSTAAIVYKGLSFRIRASIFCRAPSPVFAALFTVLSVTMPSRTTRCYFFGKAATALRAAYQGNASNDRRLSAIAKTEPLSFTISGVCGACNNNQSSETMTVQINRRFSHETPPQVFCAVPDEEIGIWGATPTAFFILKQFCTRSQHIWA